MPIKPKGPARRAAPKPEAGRKSKPKSEPQPETKLNLQGSDNAVAVGPKSFAASVKIIFQGHWQLTAGVLLVVAALLGTILWFVVPKRPDRFSKQFNVAVAEFVVKDASGNVIRSDAGSKLAESITSQIEANFNDMRLDTVTTYEIWGPDRTGVIQTEEEARQFALSTDATVIVYGQIKESNGVSLISPLFFINPAAFKEAEEITGQHELGNEVQARLNAAMPLAESAGVQARVEGMSMLTMGLVYYSVDRFDDALTYFQKADNPKWVGSGKETVYLLIGNTYIRKASNTKDFSSLSVPEQYYQAALDIDPNYGRAMIGEANVLYLRAYALNDCDPAGLEAASALLDEAFALTDQPASANIEVKVHFYRGQIALIRYDCALPGGDWPSISEREFTWVIERYEADPESNEASSIQLFVSHAYAALGYLAYTEHQDADAAIAFLQKAIPLASVTEKADYLSILGDIYVVIGQNDKAIEAYQQALAIAIGNGDAAKAEKFQQKLNSVPVP